MSDTYQDLLTHRNFEANQYKCLNPNRSLDNTKILNKYGIPVKKQDYKMAVKYKNKKNIKLSDYVKEYEHRVRVSSLASNSHRLQDPKPSKEFNMTKTSRLAWTDMADNSNFAPNKFSKS